MPFGIQPIHLIVIVVVALLIFGPQKLPEIGRGLGKALNEFRLGTREMTEGFRDEVIGASSQPAASAPYSQPVMPLPPGITCPSCLTVNAAGAAFCNHCGTKLVVEQPVQATTRICPSCNMSNNADAVFCAHCGARMQVVEPARDAVPVEETVTSNA